MHAGLASNHTILREMLPSPARFVSPLPDVVRRPLATALMFGIAGGLAWAGDLAGWPREQALIVAILAATVLLWVTEALPLFATAFISIASQAECNST